MTLRLRWHAGTLELHGAPKGDADLPPELRWDGRSACHRAPASSYAALVRALVRAKRDFVDDAKGWAPLPPAPPLAFEPRPYQEEALLAWQRAGGRGLVVLPTGAGKTNLALLAIADRRRPTLVVAPTLDLVRQWFERLREAFGEPIGVVGGGDHEVQPLTVTTYDSAWMHMDHLGRRFGMLVLDEAHHLPGSSWAELARMSLAPYRLGLTATPERADGRHALLDELVGPLVYRREIDELAGGVLSAYETRRLEVELDEDERQEHDEARALYLAFLREQRIAVGRPGGWQRFLRASAASDEGRAALEAYRKQKQLARAARQKLAVTARLVHEHRHDRALVFTDDNATAYAIARELLLPVITHQTKVRERSEILTGLKEGRYRAVVTSRVLNEGIDVPEANVAIIVSGSASVREHVQRLGRVLRPREGKRALLYELVTVGTSETSTSERRRDHVAYR